MSVSACSRAYACVCVCDPTCAHIRLRETQRRSPTTHTPHFDSRCRCRETRSAQKLNMLPCDCANRRHKCALIVQARWSAHGAGHMAYESSRSRSRSRSRRRHHHRRRLRLVPLLIMWQLTRKAKCERCCDDDDVELASKQSTHSHTHASPLPFSQISVVRMNLAN